MNSIRNGDGWWINSSVFSEEAAHFEKYGYYTPDPWGTPDWVDYWEQQLERCKNGYEVGGVRITGHHYFYLNFCPILRTKKGTDLKDTKGATKVISFPDFWDYDYNYFHSLEIARYGISPEELKKLNLEVTPLRIDGGRHLMVGKARRRGYSYKNGAICTNTYNTVRDSVVIIGAFLKEYLYPKGTMAMASDYMNFVNEHTGWAKKREFIDKQNHREAAYKEEVNGIPIKKGYKSQVIATTFKDNPDAARGKDAVMILFEEAGKFPNLKASYMATKPTLEDGAIVTGQMVIFGCVCAGTKVWTNSGERKNIEDIVQEDGIIGFDNQKYSREPITYLKPPAEKDCYRITTNTGRVLECSDDHPILWSKASSRYNDRYYEDGIRKSRGSFKSAKWKLAKDIKVKDQVAVINSVPIFGEEAMWEPRVVGWLITS